MSLVKLRAARNVAHKDWYGWHMRVIGTTGKQRQEAVYWREHFAKKVREYDAKIASITQESV